MDLFGMMVALLISFISGGSFGLCLLRQKCQVLEKRYFAPFLDLNFNKCDVFEKLDFTIAVHCDMVGNLSVTIKEIPLETDWLCLTQYQGMVMEAGAFSQLKILKALSISGNVEFLPEAFTGLAQLSILWIESETIRHEVTFYEDTFLGLGSLQKLKISGIDFSSFNFTIFNHLNQLDHLTLENNNMNHLSKITTSIGNSRNLPNLRKLSVTKNNIYELKEEDCFRSPDSDGQYVSFNITFLDLSENLFVTIHNNSLCNFPHLEVFQGIESLYNIEMFFSSGIQTIRTLSLPGFYEGSIEICKVVWRFNISELLLTYTRLEEIDTFNGSCETLMNLDLSGNFLQKVPNQQFNRFHNLVWLKLSENALKELDICHGETLPTMELEHLDVSHNLLSRIYSGQFSCLPKLQILSLENNKINIIEDFSFRGLSHLAGLNLQNNYLFTLNTLTFANLVSLKSLNLYENMIYEHMPQVFNHLVKLRELMIAIHIIENIDWLDYLGLPALTRLMIKSEDMLIDTDLHYRLSQIETFEIDVFRILLNCSFRYVFHEVKELHLKNNANYTCYPNEMHPYLIFRNLEKLHYVGNTKHFSDITLNLIRDLPLKFLHLENTEGLIKYGQVNVQKMFQGLSQLKVLHLQNSGINTLDSKDLFKGLGHLEFLLIENQDIQELNGAVLDSMPNLKYVYFLQTTFTCNCKFKELLSWMESGTTVSIINFHSQLCFINKTTSDLVSFLRSNCHSDLDVIMFIVTFVFTLLFMCISLFYESIWWHILYLVYIVKCWLNHRHRDGEQYKYDVFVSYNTHNELWVTEQLLPRLEEDGPPVFRVCIHNRDFEVGRDIIENIMDSIYNSRWTVCVITHNYLQSNWCSLEMRMATYRLLSESKDSLILVFLEEIPREELQYYHRLTKLLDKKTYLDWPDDENGQKLFWARLRKVIAKSGRKPSVNKP